MNSRQLMKQQKSGWTFVFKFKVCNKDRSVEALKVINTPSWGPAFLALLMAVGSFGAYYAYVHPPGDAGVLTATMGLTPEPQTRVMAELQEARERRELEALLAEADEGTRLPARAANYADQDVITPLNVRDPSSLVMGPGGY